ncbi:Riboflavin transport system permease protein RibX [Paenibacillus plantiphilus]|uniref:Riboflavin transport system permease protein RibX n=1 Tax=Paenibacillus plantiphilus TaxID=2905650 RepID=A0ABN8GX70_9BACL|nr:ABC transporter permease [Paenibacillus plantiphilus]CAH1218399.1 Riboflavin transport system permease protein RibX [Paenibacillus plantiphilus]
MVNKLLKLWPPLAVLAIVVLGWQAAVVLFGTKEYVLPSPLVIASTVMKEAPRLLEHTSATLGITLLGFIFGAAAGFLLAALLHLIPGAKAGFYPLLVLTQNVPVMALGPLLVIWFGFGLMPKIILLTIVCFFPISVAMLTGLTKSDPKLLSYMRMIGASKSQLFWRLELPHAIPYLFSGLKIAASYSVISAIYAETIGGSEGLGVYMRLSMRGWQTANMFAAIAVVITLSLVLFGIIFALERLFLRGTARSSKGE